MTPQDRTHWIAEELIEFHHWNRVLAESWQRRIEQMVIAAVEEEREACAQGIDAFGDCADLGYVCRDVAKWIRER